MRNNLWKHLEAEGVEEIKIEIGKDRWNSNFHEFVEEVLDENLQEGTVVKVEENGYLLFGKVLFPAKVIISKKNKK
jgi:molecular chaperone GrpE (heat shock protein)